MQFVRVDERIWGRKMNLDKILSDEYYTFLGENNNVAFYSLSIGLEEYFKTYRRVAIVLSRYDRNNKNSINSKTKERARYVKSYLNIAIHIQHFFEIETKRLLENQNILFAVDDKGDPIILNKLINNMDLTEEDTKSLKSVEFSEAIKRLKRLVEKGIITDETAKLFTDNYKLMNALNAVRNTILHRGKRIMLYCELDEFFSQAVLPLIKEVLNCQYYKWYLEEFKRNGIYDSICNIVIEGKNSTVDYSQIAYEKEIARSKLTLKKIPINIGKEDEEYIQKIVARRLKPYVEEKYVYDNKCPCCQNRIMFHGREIIDYDIEELGDEMSSLGNFQTIQIPEYAEYYECGLCGFFCTDFFEGVEVHNQSVKDFFMKEY